MSDIRIQQIKIVEVQPKPSVTQVEDVTPEVQPQVPVANPKSADEVLDFLAKSVVVSTPKGTEIKKTKIEVSKYVTPEQAAGIGESVNKFFTGMEKYVEKAVKELNLTPAQAQSLTALHFNQKFDDEDAAIVASGQRLLIT